MIKNLLLKFQISNFRTRNIAKHVAVSFVYKFGSVIANLLLVPLSIQFLDPNNYGVWLTLSSFIAWFSFFDIGLGNGLRNKFAEAKAKGDYKMAKSYVSTAYASISIICIVLIILFNLISSFVDWSLFFNAGSSVKEELAVLVPLIFSFFCVQLIFKLIISVHTADQNHSYYVKFNFLTQISSLVLIWIITNYLKSSLLLFGIIISALPLIILAVFNLFAFNTVYKEFKPAIKFFKLSNLNDIFGVGFSFFVIQIAALVIFSTDNFIISKLFSPKEVVPYNISFRYFSIVSMGFSLIVAPYWSSFTEAYIVKDFSWIKQSIKNIIWLWILIPFFLILMIIVSNDIYKFWIGEEIHIPDNLSIFMALYILLITFNMIFIQFINGVGKIRLQLIISLFSLLINIPLSIYLAKNLNMGTSGVILATCFCLSYSAFLWPIQYYKIINEKDKGIWGK